MRHLGHTIAVLFLPVLALLALGCREDTTSPAGPEAAAVAAPATALNFTQVSAGVEHVCGVASDGRAWCWGANQSGELGIPVADSPDPCSSRPCSFRPVAVSGGLRFRQVNAGDGFTCGVTTTGRVFCWGSNGVGQLGSGSSDTASSTPVEVAGNRTWRQVRAGIGNMACAISTARAAFCWGGGRLGNGTNRSRIPVKVSGGLAWAQLTVGPLYVCGVTTSAEAWCWGVNNRGQLGTGTTIPSATPVRSAAGLSIAQIEAGSAHTCAVRTDGRGVCWGDAKAVGSGNGQGRRLSPVPVAGTRTWDNIFAGVQISCGVTATTSRGFCWGLGLNGDLGNGSTADRLNPAAVSGNHDFVSISAGFAYSCGVAVGGQALCWGDNSNGQLGDGTGANSLVPVQVAPPAP